MRRRRAGELAQTAVLLAACFAPEYNSCVTVLSERLPREAGELLFSASNRTGGKNGHERRNETSGEGRELFAGVAGTAGRVHTGGFDGRPEADRTNGGRICDEGSVAAGERFGEQEGRVDGGAGAQGRRSRIDGRRRAGGVRRGRAGQDCDDGADGKTFDLRRVCSDARSARGHWNFADCLFRNGRTEEKIFAEAGDGRINWRVLLERAASGIGCAEFADAGGTECRGDALRTERAKDVDYERRVRGFVHCVREDWRGKVYSLYRRAEFRGMQTRQRRTQDGDSREFDDAGVSGKLQSAERKFAA